MADNQKEFQAGERLYLGQTIADNRSVNEHLKRYRFALKFIQPDFAVLDAACGSGYGSDMLASVAREVTGIEVNDHALQWARDHYACPSVNFLKADLNKPLPLPSAAFDIIVSFETLEHVADQQRMLGEFQRVLKPGGRLIISSPDREVITDRAGTVNKFHISELSKKEFIGLLRGYFAIESLYGQTKYAAIPWYKQLIKWLARTFDIFNLRRVIVRRFGLQLVIHKALSPIAYTPIEPVVLDAPNDFYVLIAVCRNQARLGRHYG